MGQLVMEEQAAPATPAAGTVVMYPKTDGIMYYKDDVGTETAMIAISPSGSYQIAALGVNTAAGSTGTIRATGDITASYSDDRLKDKITNIRDALEKVKMLNGFTYTANDIAQKYGFDSLREQVGLSAQEVKLVLPQAVELAPFDAHCDEHGNYVSISGENYLTLKYDRVVALLVEAVKELDKKLDDYINHGAK